MVHILTAAPAAEPISLSDAKAHLRVDGTDEDTSISSIIVAARMLVERSLGLALITQTWSHFLDAVPQRGCVALPLGPVQSVTAIRLHDGDSGSTTVDAGDYDTDLLSDPARVVLTAATSSSLRPFNGFEVAFVAGFGDDASDVPQPIRQALLLLVAHWFERREPVELGPGPQGVPEIAAGLLQPYRRVRL